MDKTPKFNFIDVTVDAYGFVWRERSLLVRLAILPLILKVVSFALVYWLGLEENYLRQGLVFLPAYFAEGALLAYAMRMALYGESGLAESAARSQAVVSSMVLYVLIKLITALFVGSALGNKLISDKQIFGIEEPALVFLLSIIFIVLLIWAFRFLWFYVPLAMGIRLKDFWVRSKAYVTSFYMIGAWLLCFVPMAFALIVLAGFLHAIIPDPEGAFSGVYFGFISILQAAFELVILLVSSIAIAYGVSDMMGQKR